jgi:hypothetical protein
LGVRRLLSNHPAAAQRRPKINVAPTKAPDRDDILNLFIVNHVSLPKEALLTSEDGNDGEVPF